jgi:ATP-dependent DNA helicase RecG
MVSERRNELIADLFHRVHFIEKWGRGINLILSKEPKTEFREVGTHFIVVFNRKLTTEVTIQKTVEKSKKKTGLVERLVERLVESQRRILKLIQVNPYISKKELANKIEISSTAIDKNITSLKKKGLLRRIGPDKGGYWEAVKK